jgi:hypothetical protein
MDMVCFFTFPSGCFHLSLFFGVDRPKCENDRRENHERHQLVDDALDNSHHRHPARMPAFLYPTIISSRKPSINTNQHFETTFTTPIPPSISLLTSFADLSLSSPALLRPTPAPSLLVPFARPPANPGLGTTTPTVLPPRDNDTAAWSPLRRHTAVSPLSLPGLVLLSSDHNDVASIAFILILAFFSDYYHPGQ